MSHLDEVHYTETAVLLQVSTFHSMFTIKSSKVWAQSPNHMMLYLLSFTHETFIEGLLCARLCCVFCSNSWFVEDASTPPLASVVEMVSVYEKYSNRRSLI